METEFERRKQFLQERNAQRVFFRMIREQGVEAPEKAFHFLDRDSARRIIENAIENRASRVSCEKKVASKNEAIRLGKEWLSENLGCVSCIVSGIGVLSGDSSDFLTQFDFLTSILGDYLEFVVPDLSKAFSFLCNEEGCFVLVRKLDGIRS